MFPTSRYHQRYEEFYNQWLEDQKRYLGEIHEAIKKDAHEHELKALVQRVAMHYSFYYRVKDEVAKQSILQFFSPSWKTPLESAFMWIGGWRPTLIFQLAYAQAGQQIESELAELIAGIDEPTMASITASQLERINELHVKTLKLEENYTHQESLLQQSLADQPFVSLAQSVTPVLGGGGSNEEAVEGSVEALEENIDEKLKELEKLLAEADRLRHETLQALLNVFTTIQAAQFLMAAAQLQLLYRTLGTKKLEEQLEEEQQKVDQRGQEQRDE